MFRIQHTLPLKAYLSVIFYRPVIKIALVSKRFASVDNGFLVNFNCYPTPNMHFLFNYSECLNFLENFTAFIKKLREFYSKLYLLINAHVTIRCVTCCQVCFYTEEGI